MTNIAHKKGKDIMIKKNIMRIMIAIMISITTIISTPIVSFAQEISTVQNEINKEDYTVGQVLTRLEGTDSGTGINSQGFYISEPMQVSLILLGRPKDGNGFVRFRLYSAEDYDYLVVKDFYSGASAEAVHIWLAPGRYSLEVVSSTGGEYIYNGTVMVYQL